MRLDRNVERLQSLNTLPVKGPYFLGQPLEAVHKTVG